MKTISKEEKNDLIGLGLFIFIGVVAVISGLYLLISRGVTKSQCDIKLDAVVTDMVSLKTGSKPTERITYAPVLEYEYNGQTYTYTSSSGSKPAKYKQGQKLKIMIDSKHPEKVYMPSDDTDSILFVLVILGGAVFVFVGIYGFGKTVRKKE